MINATEKQEKTHLKSLLKMLEDAHAQIRTRIEKYDDEIQEGKDYIWENKADLDGAEKATNRADIHERVAIGERALVTMRQIERLLDSPYFGRVDFRADDRDEQDVCYIGLHTFSEHHGGDILIYDWRAPISTLFYDYDKGRAVYDAPIGQIFGDIELKRQYKIRQGVMDYMIESAINIGDDVLQKELSQTSNEKMKNIVVTIQREQNAIIRNASANTLIVQGVAGSGKTSIALHRVAFLLYRNAETLNSENMMIISPNKVFADYISNVLPELGEENIQEIDMSDIAQDLLGDMKIQSFSDQVDFLLHDAGPKDLERIRFKATTDFAVALKSYLKEITKHGFVALDIDVDKVHIPAEDIQSAFLRLGHLPLKERLEQTANQVLIRYNNLNGDRRLNPSQSRKMKASIIKMFPYRDAFSLYASFYHSEDRQNMFRQRKGLPLAYEDVFPLIYTRLYFEESKVFSRIEHLLVDEMQDYTPIQYAVIRKLFPCRKTILGDSNQSVNPYTSTSLDVISSIFPDAETVKLCRSYRSTYEITAFAQHISNNPDLIPVERHGESPEIHAFDSDKEERRQIRKLIRQHRDSEFQTLGIICKTNKQARKLYEKLTDKFEDIYYLDFDSREYNEGIVITSAHMAKGLEFDQVIVPHIDANTYNTTLDRSLLYIACTRAMHKLDFTYYGEKTPLMPCE